MDLKRRLLLAALALSAASALPAAPQDKFITVASTTSTEQSGLFKYLLPIFERETGIRVRVVAVGTGQALDIGRRGDADVVFVHDPEAEKKFIDEGQGINYRQVMYNDFVLIGPRSDPAKIAGGRDVLEVLRRIHAARSDLHRQRCPGGTDQEMGHRAVPQISPAYSAMVRSLENLPEAATFKIALFAQPCGVSIEAADSSWASLYDLKVGQMHVMVAVRQ